MVFKSKKAQGHVEMILSFAIFVGFVFVMFIFMNPAKEKTTSYAGLDTAETIVLDNLSTNFQYIALILVNPRPNLNCFAVNNPFNFSENVLAIDENNNVVNSYNQVISPQKIYIKPTNKNSRLYKLYFSNDFADYPEYGPCDDLNPVNYTFGVLTKEKLVLFEKLAGFQEIYEENYKQLKSDLKITEDFEFVVYNLNRTQILFDTTGLHKLKTSLVLSRDIPLRIIDMNGTQSDILVNFRVW